MIFGAHLGLWRALLATAVLAACYMAFLPEPPRVPGDPPDTYLHALAFAVLAGLSRLSFPEAGFWRILSALTALGLAIECVQAIPALGREASAVDWAIDIAASSVVLVLLAPFARKAMHKSRPWERSGGL
jgi:VanZ family protein